jgi:hypothetical protein
MSTVDRIWDGGNRHPFVSRLRRFLQKVTAMDKSPSAAVGKVAIGKGFLDPE